MATESSLGPIFQMFALIPACGLLQEVKNLNNNIRFSDLREDTMNFLTGIESSNMILKADQCLDPKAMLR